MARDLTTSQVDRQNILNNENAVAEIQNQTGLQGIMFEGRLRFTKAMVASFFEVEVRTIERYVSENIEEISANGYEVIKGKRLKDFLNCVLDQDVPDINVGNISNRTPQIALFDFKAFLNISMLLVESENAKVLRQIMLDIVIDFVNQRTGGSTKYINQRDRDFISAFLQEENYRREFTDALRDYVSMGNSKYAILLFHFFFKFKEKEQHFMLYKYRIEVNNSNNLKDNDMLNCSMELSLLNNLFKENLITEAKYQEIKRKILKDYKVSVKLM